jgi:hypothetical protein
MFRGVMVAACVSLAFMAPIAAQTSIEDIEAALGSKTDEMARVDAILASPDANARIAGMELLLASGNPVFVRRAKEVGLFSSDPLMREAALKAILDAGGSITFELDTSALDSDQVERWIARLSDQGPVATDRSRITLTFQVGPYDDNSNCYMILNTNRCFLTLQGSSVALTWWFYNDMQGRVSLDAEGQLSGELTLAENRAWRGTVPVVSRLLD